MTLNDYNSLEKEENNKSEIIQESKIEENNKLEITQESKISKNALKRAAKLKLRLETKEDWKRKKKLASKLKKQEYKKALELNLVEPKPVKVGRPIDQQCSGLNLIIDLDFENYMSQKEIKSIREQIKRAYSINRISNLTVLIQLVDMGPKLKESFNGVFKECENGLPNWDKKLIDFSDSKISQLNHEKLIYLTPDAEETILDFDFSYSYIIGGLIDKNRHKATKMGIKPVKLPISEYLKNHKGSFVLTTNHVFLKTKDWRLAFNQVLPQRKFDLIDLKNNIIEIKNINY